MAISIKTLGGYLPKNLAGYFAYFRHLCLATLFTLCGYREINTPGVQLIKNGESIPKKILDGSQISTFVRGFIKRRE